MSDNAPKRFTLELEFGPDTTFEGLADAIMQQAKEFVDAWTGSTQTVDSEYAETIDDAQIPIVGGWKIEVIS